MNKSVLVGFKRFKGKNGKDYCVANIVTEYSERESALNNFGSKVQEIFLPDEFYNYLEIKHIGKSVQLGYEINGNRAYLTSFSVI